MNLIKESHELYSYTRSLTPFDAEELKEIRLESLKSYGEVFNNFYENESAKDVRYWEHQCTETPHHCFFGLFVDEELIGVMAARRWEETPDGKTAFWWGNYTKPDFRGMGLTRKLYRERIKWSQKNGMETAIAYVLQGSERPASILRKLGAEKLYQKEMSFFNGPSAQWDWYKIDLRQTPSAAAPQSNPLIEIYQHKYQGL